MGRAKRIWYLSPMRAAKVQASLRIRAVSPEPSLLAYTSSESRGTFRQKASSLAPLTGWTCAVKICHDGMLEDTNSLDGAHMINVVWFNVSIEFFSPEFLPAWIKNLKQWTYICNFVNYFCCYCCRTSVCFMNHRVIIWASSWENLSSAVYNQVRLKPACSAIETS